ncbi:hypothetical protein BN2905_32640 [Achromobacter xylosoxidans]|uniref:hypothetical protein n=1 Tax=Alcaligenes xylosoxydans xylosoxydans TaxID=85698 RepID=UPI0012A79379|nr:hypothetical protein [Achromobacter xylosoxidans]CUR74117.1 hypothetical protein BN2905_32640 [Achromobacter xylosoxidans]
MINITGGINWVKTQIQEPHKYVVRAKEVVGAACSGAAFGAVSKAVKDYVNSPQTHCNTLKNLTYASAAIGGAAAIVVGGMAGYRIAEKYGNAETSRKCKAAGAVIGALLFGASSMLAAMPFLKLSASSAEQLAQRLAPYLSNVAGAMSSKIVQSFIANVHKRESTQWQPENKKQQVTADALQIFRCLFDSLPRMSLLSISALTANYASAIGSHAGLGAAGSLLGNLYDWARSTERYRDVTHDEGYARGNRQVVSEPCKQLGMKIALSLAVAWASSSIAPGFIDATNASTEVKLVTFALVGCAVNALFADPAKQLIPTPAAIELLQQNNHQPQMNTIADNLAGGHGDPQPNPEDGIEMEATNNQSQA